MPRRPLLVLGVLGLVVHGCSRGPVPSGTADGGTPSPSASTMAVPSPGPSGTSSEVVSASASGAPASSASLPPWVKVLDAAGHCPDDMRLVEGSFCPVVVERCLEHHPEYLRDKKASERCLRFEEPTRCLSEERKPLRFCMDTFEWPNQRGAIPRVLVQWTEAKKHCEAAGKRLCDEDEWLFACEGEKAKPHVYGFTRDATKCLIDRPYRKREKSLRRYDACQADDECRTEFAKLDQRQPAGSFPECVSDFGVYDLNGNVNEWVNIPDKKYPDRSGLKGGWWGPVRNRCRPTVTFHKEDDWGYEAGFRCCADAK